MFNIFTKKDKKKEPSSEFSRFFVESKSSEKKKVFIQAARKANEEQRELFSDSRFSTAK